MAEILRLVALFDSAGKDLRRLVVELMEYFRNLLIYQYVGENMAHLDVTPEQIRSLKVQAALADSSRVLQIADQLGEMEGRLRYALSMRTLIEMSLIRCARVAQAVSLEEVLKRLNALRAAEPEVAAGTTVSVPTASTASTASATAAPAAKPGATPSVEAKQEEVPLYEDSAIKQALNLFGGDVVSVEEDDQD
jgi:DNA polymerase III gamma/tau subunit